jgi:hypothetical protein
MQRFANSSQHAENAAAVAELLRWNLRDNQSPGSRSDIAKQNPAMTSRGFVK